MNSSDRSKGRSLLFKKVRMKSRERTSILLYALMVYTVLQFFWWSYLIFDLYHDIFLLQGTLAELSEGESVVQIKEELTKKRWMIIGEGGVFLSIIILGFYLVLRARKREFSLAKQQTNFILSVTHELNTPLAAVKLNLSTLLQRKLGDEGRVKLLKMSSYETDRVIRLVNNILTTSRLESKGYKLNKTNIDLKNHFQAYLDQYSSQFKRNLNVHFDVHNSFTTDVTALEIILYNLVDNAVKYSEENQSVDIQFVQKNGILEIMVTDRGKGISENEQPQVFKKFYRIENEETRTTKGTGLGLYLVYNFVDILKGRITINSSEMGTVFTVSLPEQ